MQDWKINDIWNNADITLQKGYEMNELKCPICNSNLTITRLCDGILPNPDKGKIDEIFCDKCKMRGTEELWQELICTRKALDILLFTINRLENQNYKDCAWHLRLAIAKIEATGIANKAQEQITELERKDIK